MYIHNLDPVLLDFGLIVIRWYSLAYIFGIVIGWWFGKKIIIHILKNTNFKFKLDDFDDLISYLIISIIVGGRIGYVIFYNFNYYILNPLEIIKVWEGGMSFHGALIGIVIGTYLFSKKKSISMFFILDIIACVAPIGIFLGRIANFINSELIGKVTSVSWGVIFPLVDTLPRHPSQLYEAMLEGVTLFLILNILIFKRKYKVGSSSYLFLIYYGFFRILSEIFREPDAQIGYVFSFFSMGTILSFFMILSGFVISGILKKNEI
ncbi:prolipoprotein diacylglyceryl transferase [Candidatus Pelagibacter bacterium]|jgi:phosphatidylglycerol:prolipoprotein diacylglycerol transferase|nr:prolipoprotein diacylglyceryl transferase [Candidatus Pelagibacter bacterium]MDC0447780.1 prolipoprotein diacylglyceryl transferase [Pelagibacteraceae bacterium]